jgi:Zn-dependent protease with chaperone function
VSFQSNSLDELAEVMQVTKILKKSKLERYYKVRTTRGGFTILGKIFFDAKYFETLLSNEVLAVGAHEFTHLNQRHGRKRFWRLLVPAISIGGIIGVLVFLNFDLIDPIPFFNNFGKGESSLFATVFSSLFAFFASFYVNARWLRQQETECDLSSVKFLNGEAMVSALIKLSELRPKKMNRLDRLLPKLYPTLEQRIEDIRTAERKQEKSEVLR